MPVAGRGRRAAGSRSRLLAVRRAKLSTTCAGERVHPLEPLGGVLGPDRRPRRVVLVARAGTGQRASRNSVAPSLVTSSSASVPSGSTHVLGVVLHARAAGRRPSAAAPSGSAASTHPHLAGVAALRPDHDQAAAAGRPHARARSARPAPPAPARRRRRACRARAARPGTAGRLVVDACRRSAPSPRSRRPRSSVRGTTSARSAPVVEVAEPQLVDLVAGRGRPSRPAALVRADRVRAPARRSRSRRPAR